MNKITHALMSILFTPVYQDQDILVCYASQTGTAANLANQSGKIIRKMGRNVDVSSLSSLQPSDFNTYNRVLMIVSTCGEGEIPDDGKLFYEELKAFPSLAIPVNLLALGDKSYGHYCMAGKLLHDELKRMGAVQEEKPTMVSGNPMQTWQRWLSQQLGHEVSADQTTTISTPVKLILEERTALHTTFDSSNSNQAFHITFTIKSDSIVPYHVNDLLSITPSGSDKERLYSVASSPTSDPTRISLCVAKHQFVLDGELKNGLCSNYLIEQLEVGNEYSALIKTGAGMPLPERDIPTILVATGAGIAPMMSILEERRQQQHTGQNWLIFGNRYRAQDFYYQNEISQYLSDSVITQLDTAFSRDSEQKMYVQNKLRQKRSQLMQWLITDKAQMYVCGRPELKEEILTVIKETFLENNVSKTEATERINVMQENGQITFELF